MNNRVIKTFYIIFFCLSSCYFYFPYWVPLSLLYYIYYAVFFVTCFLIFINFGKYSSNVFSAPMLMLISAILISAFSSRLLWSQNILDSFIAILPSLSYSLFFLLIIFKMPVQDIEKIIIFSGVLYILLYLFTYISYHIPTFSYGRADFGADRGFRRILLNGLGYLLVFSFYSLNQYFNKHKLWWLIIYFITLILIIMTLTRMIIVSSFILSTLYVLRKSNFFYKIIALTFIVCFVYLISKTNVSQTLFEQTKSHTENLKDYIRVRSADFYLHDFSPNIIAKVFGNGQPGGGSNYAFYLLYIERSYGFYLSDLGYVGLYVKFGLLAVLAYLILIYRTIKISVPDEYLYCKYSLYMLFIISTMGDALYTSPSIPVNLLLIYVLVTRDLSQKNINVI
jgi:hypothetical protein